MGGGGGGGGGPLATAGAGVGIGLTGPFGFTGATSLIGCGGPAWASKSERMLPSSFTFCSFASRSRRRVGSTREGSVLARRILRSEGRNSSTVSRFRELAARRVIVGGRISGPTAGAPVSEAGKDAAALDDGRAGAELSSPWELGHRKYTRTSNSAARIPTFHGSSPTPDTFQFIGRDLPVVSSAPTWREHSPAPLGAPAGRWRCHE